MKEYVSYIIVILFLTVSNYVSAQCESFNAGIVVASDTLQCVKEKTNLTVSGASGTVSWIYSNQSGAWFPLNDVSGNTITVYPDVNTSYATYITDGLTCSDTSNKVSIEVSFFPEIPDPGRGDDKVCGLAAWPSAYPEQTGSYTEYWTKAYGPGNAIFYPDSSKYATDSVVVDAYGTYGFAWNMTDGICTKESVVEFIFNEIPIANAGLDTSYCNTFFYMNASLYFKSSIGKWFKVPGTNFTIDDVINPQTSINASEGSHKLVWEEVSVAGCRDRDTITIDVARMPSVYAGNDANTCGNELQLSATSTIYSHKWEWVEGPDSLEFDNNTSNTAMVTVNSYGEGYILQWIVVNSFCVARDTVVLNFYENPVADAGVNNNVCGSNAQLEAFPSVGTGKWTQLVGAGTAVLNNPDTILTNVFVDKAFGDYSFIWEENNNGCMDSDTLYLSFFEVPIANPGTGGIICSADSLSYKLDGVLSIGTGCWTYDGVGKLKFYPDTLTPDAIVTAQNEGSYLLTWTENSNGCTSDSTIEVKINIQPEVSVMSDTQVCGESLQIEAFSTLGESQWTKVNGSGEISFYNSEEATTNASVSEDNYGLYTVMWKADNNGCTDSALVQILFKEQPKANAGSDTSVCGLSCLLGARPTVGESGWTCIGSPDMLEFLPDSTISNAEVNVSGSGSYYLVWEEANGNCTDSDTILVSFLDVPEAIAGEDLELDNKYEAVMLANVPSNEEQGSWQLISGAGIVTNETSYNSDVTGLEIGENMFTWTVKNDLCESIDSVKLTVYDIFVPQVITPNGDGDNDCFFVTGIDEIDNVELIIMNRWGGEVYYSSDYQNEWGGFNKKGQELTNDTYFYVLKISDTRIIKSYVVIKR